MTVSITLDGALTLDQTAGLQLEDDDVDVAVTPVVDPGSDILTGSLDADFLAFLNSLSSAQLSDAQKAFADLVEGASDPDYVTVQATAGETVSRLFLSDASGAAFNGDAVEVSPGVAMTTIDGQPLYLWSALDGSVVLVTTSNLNATSGSVAAAFYLEPNNLGNTSATLQSISFIPFAHPNANDPDDTLDFGSLVKVSAIVSTTPDIEIDDDGPTAPTVVTSSTVTHDETPLVQVAGDPNASNDVLGTALPPDVLAKFTAAVGTSVIGYAASTASLVTATGGSFGTDGAASTTPTVFAISVTNESLSGLSTNTGTQIFLYNADGLVLGRVGTENGANDIANANGDIAFALQIGSSDGFGYIVQKIALNHGTGGSDAAAYDNDIALGALGAGAINLTVTLTDKDGDHVSSTPLNIASLFHFQDDGPSITTAPATLTLNNADDPLTGTAAFGFDVGQDNHTLAQYQAGATDFVDVNGAAAGVMTLTGTVDPTTGSESAISNGVVTRTAETDTSATFSVAFDYDGNPLLAGSQTVHETGTLTFDKTLDTYSLTLDDPISAFSTTILRTSGFIAKEPDGNTGHPLIVAEQLTPNGDPDPFFVQFTADNSPLWFTTDGDGDNSGDTAFNGAAHDMAGGTETWVSATRDTNGVAGDTIQKGELLTLRFFEENILGDVASGTERTTPTATADGIAIKFDNIGAAEDLVMILDLKASDGTEITRAILVDNSDIFKVGHVPPGYDFTLDNNDGLVVIESNDYNLTSSEHYEIQGVQIMQSANGLTGTGINLNGAVGSTGGSATNGTQSFTDASFGNENDVLKITDIGFIQTQSGTQDAHLDFGLQITDADTDVTGTQTLHVDILNI